MAVQKTFVGRWQGMKPVKPLEWPPKEPRARKAWLKKKIAAVSKALGREVPRELDERRVDGKGKDEKGRASLFDLWYAMTVTLLDKHRLNETLF